METGVSHTNVTQERLVTFCVTRVSNKGVAHKCHAGVPYFHKNVSKKSAKPFASIVRPIRLFLTVLFAIQCNEHGVPSCFSAIHYQHGPKVYGSVGPSCLPHPQEGSPFHERIPDLGNTKQHTAMQHTQECY